MRRFHIWYDRLPPGRRFAFFFFAIALPFVLGVNVGIRAVSPLFGIGMTIIVTCYGALAVSRVRYIESGKKRG